MCVFYIYNHPWDFDSFHYLTSIDKTISTKHHKYIVFFYCPHTMSHIFYSLMKYPVPLPTTQFLWLEEDHEFTPSAPVQRSWPNQPSSLMLEYLDYLSSYARLFRSIPFVEHIYLCNSITFNALHEDSDIDILIISKPWCIRLARRWSWLLCTIIWLKRFGSHKVKKLCLSCYIDSDHCNLYATSLQPYDIYLCYWIAHLVPLYSCNTSYVHTIYTANHRITHFLPNIQLQPNITLGIDIITWESYFKRFIERFQGWRRPLQLLFTQLIKTIRLPILHYKIRRLGDKGSWIIVNDTMLKFYHDRRKRINYQYKQTTKLFSKKEEHKDESLF